ncbi:MAG: hypothetical protein U0359_10535 [Byssovorax sp.]
MTTRARIWTGGAVIALLSAISTTGCTDPCEEATAKITDCIGHDDGSVSTIECKGIQACSADCINATDCDALRDAAHYAKSSGAKAFQACEQACASLMPP